MTLFMSLTLPAAELTLPPYAAADDFWEIVPCCGWYTAQLLDGCHEEAAAELYQYHWFPFILLTAQTVH